METDIKWILKKFKRNSKSKKRREDRFKENTRTNKSTNKTNIINKIVNLPSSSSQTCLSNESNNKKNHCLLNIWKHETGIKINFDLWKS